MPKRPGNRSSSSRSSMVVMLGMAALGIDVATWYTEHHQTQVVADSAALAAANCLAHPNIGPSGASL